MVFQLVSRRYERGSVIVTSNKARRQHSVQVDRADHRDHNCSFALAMATAVTDRAIWG